MKRRKSSKNNKSKDGKKGPPLNFNFDFDMREKERWVNASIKKMLSVYETLIEKGAEQEKETKEENLFELRKGRLFV